MPIGHFTSRRSRDDENGTATVIFGYEGNLGFTIAEVIDLRREGEQTELQVFVHNGIFGSENWQII
jgi:hypothetical protein